LYLKCLTYSDEMVDGKIFNAGYENNSVMTIAELVRDTIGSGVRITRTETDDLRSYHISSDKIAQELGFIPQYTIADAVQDLKNAFDKNMVRDSLTNPVYFNVKTMQDIEMK
jgi:nucleoside-diphosphate-sugar epimerase